MENQIMMGERLLKRNQ